MREPPQLGVRPLLGRTFLPGEDQPGRADVIVLSQALWQRRFGGDPGVVGRTVQLDDGSYTIVGVMPASFWVESKEAGFWRPLGYTSSGRMQHQYGVIGRLAPGVPLDAAQTQMAAIARRAAEAHPDAQGWSIVVSPLGRDETDAARAPLLILIGAVALVLLIACANVANLLFARVAARSREMAIRTARPAPAAPSNDGSSAGSSWRRWRWQPSCSCRPACWRRASPGSFAATSAFVSTGC